MNTRPQPSHVIRRELDRAVAMGTLASYRFSLGPAGNRRWTLIYPDGTRREAGSSEVEAFIDGIALAEAARDEAVQ